MSLESLYEKPWSVVAQAQYEINLHTDMARLVVARIDLARQIEVHNLTEIGFSDEAITATKYMTDVLNGAIFGLYREMQPTLSYMSAKVYVSLLDDYFNGNREIMPLTAYNPISMPKFLNQMMNFDYTQPKTHDWSE